MEPDPRAASAPPARRTARFGASATRGGGGRRGARAASLRASMRLMLNLMLLGSPRDSDRSSRLAMLQTSRLQSGAERRQDPSSQRTLERGAGSQGRPCCSPRRGAIRQRHFVWLWPEVSRVPRRSAELQRHEVVLLVVTRIPVGVAVLHDLRELERRGIGRRWPGRRRPAALADRRGDVRLVDAGIDCAGTQPGVGQPWPPRTCRSGCTGLGQGRRRAADPQDKAGARQQDEADEQEAKSAAHLRQRLAGFPVVVAIETIGVVRWRPAGC